MTYTAQSSCKAGERPYEPVSSDTLRVGRAYSNIYSLPPEVLGHIFLYVQQTRTGHRDWHSYDWLVLLAVCRLWYAVATGFPALWANIFVGASSKPEFIELSLLRSKQALLGFKVYVPKFTQSRPRPALGQDSQALCSKILREMRRMQELRLVVTAKRCNMLREDLRRPAPHLRHYYISINDEVGWQTPDDQALAPQSMPRLETFSSLRVSPLPWHALSSAAGLRVLVIQGFLDQPIVPLSLVMTALAGMPRLNILTLADIPMAADFDSALGIHTTTLSELQSLELTGGPCLWTTLVPHLRVSPTSYVKLSNGHTTTSQENSELMTNALCSILTGSATTSPPDPIYTLLLRFTDADPGRFRIQGWSKHLDLTPHETRRYVKLTNSSFACNLPCDSWSMLPATVAATLPFENVTVLWLDSFILDSYAPLHYGPDDFTILANALPKVTILWCYAWAAHAFAEFISERKSVKPTSPIWPHLTSLTFAGDFLQPRGFGAEITAEYLKMVLERRCDMDLLELSQFNIESSTGILTTYDV